MDALVGGFQKKRPRPIGSDSIESRYWPTRMTFVRGNRGSGRPGQTAPRAVRRSGIRIDRDDRCHLRMSEAQRQFNAAVDSRREGAAAFEKSQQAIKRQRRLRIASVSLASRSWQATSRGGRPDRGRDGRSSKARRAAQGEVRRPGIARCRQCTQHHRRERGQAAIRFILEKQREAALMG